MKNIIKTSNAPTAIGPYNQAVKIGNFLFSSGQIAINPYTGELELEDIESETKLVMENVQAVLKAANLEMSAIVKTSIFITDMANFDKINKVYASFFDTDFPARETVEVAGLPKGVNIEISVIAAI